MTMKFTRWMNAVQHKTDSIIDKIYNHYDCKYSTVFEFRYNGKTYRPIAFDKWAYLDNGDWIETSDIEYKVSNESLFVIDYLFKHFKDLNLYEIISDIEDVLYETQHIEELDFYSVCYGIEKIREDIEKKYPGVIFTENTDIMIGGFRDIQRILDGTISKYVIHLIEYDLKK